MGKSIPGRENRIGEDPEKDVLAGGHEVRVDHDVTEASGSPTSQGLIVHGRFSPGVMRSHGRVFSR